MNPYFDMDSSNEMFHIMSKGEGDTSYLLNSGVARTAAMKSMPILKRAVESLLEENIVPFDELLNVADLGCSTGSTSFGVISTIIQTVEKKCRELNRRIPEFQIYLNDVEGNDFNTLFKGLSGFVKKCSSSSACVVAAPGSFHGKLFPVNTMHLVYSNYAVQWLSKAPEVRDEKGRPINKGKIFITKTSPKSVREAYLTQFQHDLSLFLKSRAREMVSKGRVLFILHGRLSQHHFSETQTPWTFFTRAISRLVSKGLIDEERLDSFEVPYYTPSEQELREVVEREGSYVVEHIETFTIKIEDKDIWSDARGFANNLRAFTEPMISHHFGAQIVDKLYEEVYNFVVEDFTTQIEPNMICNYALILKRQ